MKKTRRVFALLLTVAMCMAMSVSAFATEADLSSQITTKTYELGDGIVVTVTTAPNEITPMIVFLMRLPLRPQGILFLSRAVRDLSAQRTSGMILPMAQRCR